MRLLKSPRSWLVVFSVAASLFCPGSLAAEVVRAEADGFQIKISTGVECDHVVAYDTFVDEFSNWWDANHSYTGKAENLSLDLEKHCLLERLPGDGFVRHMEVVFHQPGNVLRMTGGLGPLQEMGVAGSLSFVFEKSETGTQIVATYNVSGASHLGLDKIAEPVDGVLTSQLERFKELCDRGSKNKDQPTARVSTVAENAGQQVVEKNLDEQDADPKSDAEKAALILKHDIGVWDCTWEYLDADAKVSRTVTGVESMRASLGGKVIEMETFVPEGELTSKSLRFYNSTTNKLTLLSVGPDGNHWELNQNVDSDVMTSKPHPTVNGEHQWIRFTTIESTSDKMKVMMEISRDEENWRKVFYQTLVRRK